MICQQSKYKCATQIDGQQLPLSPTRQILAGPFRCLLGSVKSYFRICRNQTTSPSLMSDALPPSPLVYPTQIGSPLSKSKPAQLSFWFFFWPQLALSTASFADLGHGNCNRLAFRIILQQGFTLTDAYSGLTIEAIWGPMGTGSQLRFAKLVQQTAVPVDYRFSKSLGQS
jgi:hypothetical protein